MDQGGSRKGRSLTGRRTLRILREKMSHVEHGFAEWKKKGCLEGKMWRNEMRGKKMLKIPWVWLLKERE